MSVRRGTRLAVYLDYVHRRQGPQVYAPRAFALFVAGLRSEFERVTIAGRLDPVPGESHYPVPADIDFVEMPHYASAADPRQLLRALASGAHRWWRLLDDVDIVWVLGPQGLALPLALLALARRRRVCLGVRQDLPAYARSRHPGRRGVHRAADLLDLAFRSLGRVVPVVVVGPALAKRFAASPELLQVTISLVSERDLASAPPTRAYGDELEAISVGRLEEEKNPLLLADILAQLRALDPRWRLTVCGEGPLEQALRDRLAALGVADAAQLRGYLSLEGGLRDAYHRAHAFLHVSRTEGLPQVLYEAFGARLPVVATDVGSVREAAGDAALIVAPDDAEASARRLAELGADGALRARLVAAGERLVRAHTLEAELQRAAAFLRGDPPVADPAAIVVTGGVAPMCS